jgi:RimJ/RimL family protein N-acetyltransferase
MPAMMLQGPHVTLRPWHADDIEPFAALNADPRVMEYLPAMLSREEAAAMIGRAQAAIDERGWGMWALESRRPLHRLHRSGDPSLRGALHPMCRSRVAAGA